MIAAEKDPEVQELCDYYLGDLFEFAKYINPHYVYGDIHEEMFRELQYEGELNQLYLIPRAHLKSHVIATWAVWFITKHRDLSCQGICLASNNFEARIFSPSL